MSKSLDQLTYSDNGLANRTIFLSSLNDINFFVEDIGKEYIYEEIFERLFENRIKLFCIFPLGGKNAVLQKHKECTAFDSCGKLNLFIVDGDFDNLWEEQKTESQNLIYLDRYNIESYFCSKESVILFLRSFLKLQRNKIETLIDYNTWVKLFREESGQLFSLFALVQHRCLGVQNVNAATKFLDVDGRVDPNKYQQYRGEISSMVESLDAALEEIHERVQQQFSGDEENRILSIICGKHQIESLCRYLKSCCKKEIDRKSIIRAFINSFDVQQLRFIKDRAYQLLYPESSLQN